MRQVQVFFYGLFMDEEVLRERGIVTRPMRSASVNGYELRIGKRATLVPAAGSVSFGMLIRLTHDELDALYAEPTVAEYRAEPVIATMSNGDQVPALCFTLPEPPAREEHNPEYAARLRMLAQRLRFPAEYVASIK